MPSNTAVSPKNKKTLVMLIISVVFVILVGVIIFLCVQLNRSETKPKALVPCLDSGRCLVGVSFSDNIPGFRVKNGKEYFGFDVDMANYLSQRLGRDAPLFVQADRDQSLADPGKPVHMYISTVSMTDERRERMLFVGPYMRTFQGMMVTNDSQIRTRDDLASKAVCAAEGTTSYEALRAYSRTHPVDVKDEATVEQCIQGLKSGRYDAVTGDYITLQTHAHADTALLPLPEIRISDGYELYGVALPKDSMALCQKLKPILKDFIREKWEPAFQANLKDLGITYDLTNTSIPSLKPGESIVDTNSCKAKG